MSAHTTQKKRVCFNFFLFFRKKTLQSEEDENATEQNDQDLLDSSTSKIGQIVSEEATKKVIILVLTLVLVLPWLEPSSESFYASAETTTELFDLAVLNVSYFKQ